MTNIAERAVNAAEESNSMTKKVLNNTLPEYFALGHILEEMKIDPSDKKKVEERFKSKELAESLNELYLKGIQSLSEKSLKSACKGCKKPIIKGEDVKFCQYCGEKS